MALVTNTAAAIAPRPDGNYTQSIVQFLRPNDTGIYAGGDVISDSTGTAAALQFPACTRSGAIRNIHITNRLETDTITPRLWIFDAEPTKMWSGNKFVPSPRTNASSCKVLSTVVVSMLEAS